MSHILRFGTVKTKYKFSQTKLKNGYFNDFFLQTIALFLILNTEAKSEKIPWSQILLQ